jgi:hypothetical protein
MDAEHVSEAFEPQGGHIHAHESPFQPAKHHVAVEKNAADRLLEPSSNDVPGGPIQPAKGWPRSLLSAFHPDIWLYEMLSLLIAMAAFACVVVVLRKYENKPSPQWPSGITLNSVVSWIATIFRTCLLMPVAECISQLSWVWFSQKTRPLDDTCYYDSASRGPLGSLKLLFRLKIR